MKKYVGYVPLTLPALPLNVYIECGVWQVVQTR